MLPVLVVLLAWCVDMVSFRIPLTVNGNGVPFHRWDWVTGVVSFRIPLTVNGNGVPFHCWDLVMGVVRFRILLTVNARRGEIASVVSHHVR